MEFRRRWFLDVNRDGSKAPYGNSDGTVTLDELDRYLKETLTYVLRQSYTITQKKFIRRKDLIEALTQAGAKSVTLFLDTCYSGGTRGKESLIASARPLFIAAKEDAAAANVTIFAAAANNQLSSSLAQVRHGLFSYYLMKGLEGEAAGADRIITASSLQSYLVARVPGEAAKLGRTQTPQLVGDGSRVISSR